jgi:hypothetical protein
MNVARNVFRWRTLCWPASLIAPRPVSWIQHQISRRVLKRLDVPPEWLAEGPDGFQAEDEMDILFGFGKRNLERVGCCSESELIELANRRRPMADPDTATSGTVRPAWTRSRTSASEGRLRLDSLMNNVLDLNT